MSLKFGRIQAWTAELAALTNLKNLLLENYSKYFDDLLSGERSLPFELLVFLNYLPLQIWTLKICFHDISKTIAARSFKLGQLIEDDE